MNERIDYLKCRESLNNLGISDDEINKALDELQIQKENLCDEVALERREPWSKPFEFIKTGTSSFKKYKDGYVKEYTASANFYRVPATYQGLKHGAIIHKILSNRYNWFDTFQKDKSYQESETAEYFDTIGRLDVKKLPEKYLNMTVAEVISLKEGVKINKKESAWSLYEMNKENYEIYLHTQLGTLYVPIKAILNKDIQLIKDRMMSYSMRYSNITDLDLSHRTESNEKKIKDYENMIAPLRSKEAELLFNYIQE